MAGERVLSVDDDPAIRELVSDVLTAAGMVVVQAETCAEAIEVVRGGFRGVMVLDVRLPDGLGPDLMVDLARIAPDNPVILLTSYGSTTLALESIQHGAFDFIEKTQLVDRLVNTVQGAWQAFRAAAVGGLTLPSAFDTMVTRSAAMRTLFRSLEHALDSKVPVLVRGESGTGKELIARAVHAGGPRRDGPFVAVNCAGIPDQLPEAELFGFEKGAFTGAAGRKLGRFDLARGGTLLLDEIGEMDPSLQAKLLRVLQEGEYQRLGGVETLKADVRLVSATNRNLEDEVKRGRFREDLYYRLAVFTVDLPPLRDRHGDIKLLAEHFLRKSSAEEGKSVRNVGPMALEVLESYSFPGNVRQLENVIAHAVVSAPGTSVRIADFPASFRRAVQLERGEKGTPTGAPLRSVTPGPGVPWSVSPDQPFPTLAQMEQQLIRAAIARADGNKAEAARLLGISRMTLYRKLA